MDIVKWDAEIQTCEMTHEMAFEAIHIQFPQAYMIFLSVG